MEKLSASLIASLTVIFVYLSMKELADRRTAFIVAMVFAFATNTWTISSQALWQHGLVELFLAMLIFLVLIYEKHRSNRIIICLGILSGLLLFNRPVDGILLIPIIYYIVQMRDVRIIYYIAAAALSSAPFIFYNFNYFGSFFGGYISLLNRFDLSSDMIVRLMGLLISPSRGLFIYTPIMLLSIFGYFKVFKISNKNIKDFLLVSGFSSLLLVVVYSAFGIWWAGGSYGPRFLTGMLPVLAIYLGLFLKYIDLDIKNGKKLLKICIIIVLLLWSCFAQFVGAFYYPNGGWDGNPNVDFHPEKLWDWNDTQIKRTFNAGMFPLIDRIKSIATLASAKDIVNDGIRLAGGWYGIEMWDNVSTRWTKSDAAFEVFSPKNCTANLNLKAHGFLHPRIMVIYVGDDLAASAAVPTEFIEMIVPVNLEKGTNTIRLHLSEGCMRPCDIPELNSPDCRCLGLAVQNIEIFEQNPTAISTSFSTGFNGFESWSGVPTQWMDPNATLSFSSPVNRSFNLSLRAMSFYRPRTLEIYVGNELAGRSAVSNTTFTDVNAHMRLVKGTNTVRLHVPEGCERPSHIKEINSQDSRCLSIAVQNVTAT
jgi:hypothetical protein